MRTNRKLSPCVPECPERRLGCHSSCPRYRDMQEARRALRAEEARDRDFRVYQFENAARIRERRHRK